jgi:hypothetical protein
MRVLVLMFGFLGLVSGAAAGDAIVEGSDAAAGQLVYEARFGGAAPGFKAASFQLQFGNDHQVMTRARMPLVAEYRPATQTVLLNGMDLAPMYLARQAPETGFGTWLGGWIPLMIVLTAAAFIAVDGNDLTPEDLGATGGSGS